MKDAEFVVYGDFNCPFCYALNKILLDVGLNERFQWRSIEHLPGISSDQFSLSEQSTIAAEVFTVRHRAPDIDIAIPPCRPNTALANRLLINVTDMAPALAPVLRQRIYCALWVEGQDISNKQVLLALLTEINAELDFSADQLFAEHLTLEQWQLCWEQTDSEGRIPIITNSERALKGLCDLPEIRRFIGGELVAEDAETSCYIKPRQNVVILGEIGDLWRFIETLRHQYHLHLLHTTQALWQMIEKDHLPDLILVDLDAEHEVSMTLCEQLKAEELTRPIPLVLVADKISINDEVRAYEIGVSDYMKRNRAPEVFKARIDMLLQLKMTRDALDKAARLDSLTQIYNRREFDRVILQEWRRCARSRSALSLLMLDIDYFKRYNDCYGHLAGDGCIRMLAQTMKHCADRVGDLVSRYGGEEFAILLPDTDARGAIKVAKNIQREINALHIQHEGSDTSDHVTISIGCFTLTPTQDGDPVALIAGADDRLYRAKAAGRDTVIGDELIEAP